MPAGFLFRSSCGLGIKTVVTPVKEVGSFLRSGAFAKGKKMEPAKLGVVRAAKLRADRSLKPGGLGAALPEAFPSSLALSGAGQHGRRGGHHHLAHEGGRKGHLQHVQNVVSRSQRQSFFLNVSVFPKPYASRDRRTRSTRSVLLSICLQDTLACPGQRGLTASQVSVLSGICNV